MKGFAGINKYYLERKRRQGFNDAKEAGTVGRPRMTEGIEKAIRLYNTKAFYCYRVYLPDMNLWEHINYQIHNRN